MAYSKIHYSVTDGVAVIELSDPPANTYSYEMMREIDGAILDARLDPAVHVLVLRGEGDRFFCAGANIGMLRKADAEWKYYFCLHANETLMRLEQTPKLVIAALNGHTVGGGLEVALAADLRIARQGSARIGMPEVALGVLPGTGGTQRLSRILGKARALELMISGRLISFDEARGLGLVTEVWDDATLAGRTFERAILDYAWQFTPPSTASRAVGRIKRAVHAGIEAGFLEALSIERELQQLLFQSDDAREGLAANVEKRTARFTGR